MIDRRLEVDFKILWSVERLGKYNLMLLSSLLLKEGALMLRPTSAICPVKSGDRTLNIEYQKDYSRK